jgi:hypothetical protein
MRSVIFYGACEEKLTTPNPHQARVHEGMRR